MKTICYTILFLLFSAQSYSQKIHFTDPGNFWKVREVYIFGSNTPEDFYFDFWYTTDTVIGSTTYKRMICSDSLSRGYVREDTTLGIVYYYDIAGGFEDTLYDYNLHGGDSITFFINSTNITDKVDFIDTVVINGINYNDYFYACNNCYLYSFSRYYTLLEGIGSMSGPIYPLSTGECQSGASTYDYTLACFSHDGISPNFNAPMYSCAGSNTLHNSGTCFPTIINSINYKANNTILFPNPAKETIRIETTFDFGKKGFVTIADVTGRPVCNIAIISSSSTIIQTIDISNLCDGVYFVYLISENGTKIINKLIKE